jgi:adenosylmethionine-8-amino-7-oxononanoate aminotransferase
MFACEHAGVTPDLMCAAKGITGGYLPLAATLATEEIFSAFLGRYEERKTFFHGHTYTGNPLACAAAIASLDLFAEERILDRVAATAERLGYLLDERIAPLPHVAEVRRWGMMVGIELLKDVPRRVAYDSGDRIGHRVIRAARPKGVIIRPLGDIVILMPPLSIGPDELERLIDVTAASIREITER